MNIIGNVCLFLAVVIENIACLWFIREMVYKRERKLKNKEIGLLMIPVMGITILEFTNRAFFAIYSESMLLLKIFLLWGPVLLIRRKKGWTAFTAAVTFVTLNMLADFLVEFLFILYIDGYQYSVYISQQVFNRRIGMLFVRVISLLLCYIIQKGKVELHDEKLMCIFSVIGLVSMRYFFIILTMNDRAENVLGMVSLAAVIIIFVLSFFSSSYYRKNNENADFLEQKNLLLEKGIENFYRLYRENKYLSHDLKNHVNLLCHLMKQEEYGKAVEYLEKLREPVTEMEEVMVSGNRIIDLVLSDKMSLAKEKNIKMMLEIDQVGMLPLLEQDICVILSNLLDNAVEACEHVDDMEKWIRMKINRDGNILLFCIENSFQGEIVQKNGKIMTNKKEVKRHGLGIASVKYVVDKYQGSIEQEIKGCIFSCSVILFL